MVMINLTKKQAKYLFYVMVGRESEGEETATGIKNKIPGWVL